jgi:hypothetical protein
MNDTCTSRDRALREVAIVRDMMLAAHYVAEPSWLVGAMAFPAICKSPEAQDALRRAATLSWQFGFPAVSHWLTSEILMEREEATLSADESRLPSDSPHPAPL